MQGRVQGRVQGRLRVCASLQDYGSARAHMEGFIKKFRYNAKRASLVQSRVKALDGCVCRLARGAGDLADVACSHPLAVPSFAPRVLQ